MPPFKPNLAATINATLELNKLSTTPEQKEGVVVIIFDDANKTILPAADIMNKYGIKGNTAVIGEYLMLNHKNNLDRDQLKELQDVHGWNIVSHSAYHQDALTEYYDKGDLEGLENDIITNAQYLIELGINSAPNWYVYPHGSTNSEIEEIIGKYYKFARLDSGWTEVFPFAEPLGVNAYLVLDNTPPNTVKKLILDARENKLTLFLTFHRIKTSPLQDAGYDIRDFENIISYISEQGIKVETLSELDKDNGVSMNQITITDAIPEQIMLDVKINK